MIPQKSASLLIILAGKTIEPAISKIVAIDNVSTKALNGMAILPL
jgi:hypothetical protein